MRLKNAGLIAMLLALWASPRLSDAQGVLTGKQTMVGLCAITTCPPANAPVIKSLDQSSPITPGGKVVLQGANFNSSDGKPGSIVLKIGSKKGVAVIHLGQQSYQAPYVERQLTVLGWADSHVFGQIPDDIVGVFDGSATLEVARSDGVRSPTFIVQFKATQDLVALPPDAIQVQSCSNQPDENLCNNVSDNSALKIPTDLKYTWSVYGQHVNFVPNAEDNPWSDTYTFSVKNGWDWDPEYLKNWGTDYAISSCKDTLFHLDNTRPAKGQGKARFSSSVLCDTAYHHAYWIFGPKGVPWR